MVAEQNNEIITIDG